MTDDTLPYSPEHGVSTGVPWHGTQAELKELVNIFIRHYGDCACVPCPPHAPSHVHVCASHAFYNERDDTNRTLEWTGIAVRDDEGSVVHSAHLAIYGFTNSVFRTDRLLFARRMRSVWMRGEGIEASTIWRSHVNNILNRGIDDELDDRLIAPENPENFDW